MTRARTYALVLALALALALAALGLAGCGGGDDEAVSADSIAVVDGTEVSKAEFDQYIARSKKQAEIEKREFPKVGTAEYKSVQNNIVTYLVRRTENEKEAAALGIVVTDAEIQERLDQVKTQLGGEDKFQQAVKQQGLTLNQVRDDISGQLLSQKLVDKLTKDVKVADADVKKYYEENKAQFRVPESREVRHILVKSKGEAMSIRAQLENGADFVALAKKYSQDPGSKDAGGKLTITKGQTVPPFEQASFTLKTNELSQPIKTQFGYHLIQPLGEIKKASTTPLATVKTQIEAQLADTKRSDVIGEWSKDVEKKYDGKISYAKGYAPPTTTTTTETTG